jgi:hypothetical protein
MLVREADSVARAAATTAAVPTTTAVPTAAAIPTATATGAATATTVAATAAVSTTAAAATIAATTATVAAATATATTAVTTATATTAATATAAAFTLAGLVDAQRTAFHVLTVQPGDGRLRVGLGHFDKTKAAETAGLAVVDQAHGVDSTVLREQRTDRLFIGGVWQISYVDPGHGGYPYNSSVDGQHENDEALDRRSSGQTKLARQSLGASRAHVHGPKSRREKCTGGMKDRCARLVMEVRV